MASGETQEARQTAAIRNLWAAVLGQGIVDACEAMATLHERPAGATDKYVAKLAARRWLFAHDTHVGSFDWVCGALDLDPRRVREYVVSRDDDTADALLGARKSGRFPKRGPRGEYAKEDV